MSEYQYESELGHITRSGTYIADFTTGNRDDAAYDVLRELQRLESQLATARAAREAAEAKAANLYDAIRQHLVVWNNIIESGRSDNAVMVATDTQSSMLSMLDSVEGDFSVVMIGDAFKTLDNVLNGSDSYYIKLYKEVLAERAEALQAENARLVAGVLRCPKCSKWEQVEFFEGLGYCCHDCKININVSIAPPTPPATESAQYALHDMVVYKAPHGTETGVICDMVSKNGKTVYYVRDTSVLNIKEDWIIKKIGESRIDPNYIASWLKPDKNES